MSDIAPGWYPDPDPRSGGTSTLRWWDGRQWTEHLAPGSRHLRTTPDGERLAGWWSRVAALLVDYIFVWGTTAALGWPFVRELWTAYLESIRQSIAAAERGASSRGPAPTELYGEVLGPVVAITLLGFAVSLAYHGASLRWGGASPGKRLLGLRVRLRDAPGQLPWPVIVRRLGVSLGPQLVTAVPFLGTAVGIFAWLDGLWPLWDSRNQALHDKAAGTNVVRVR